MIMAATAKELASAAPEPARSKLLALAAMLKETAQNVQRLNRINAIATHKVLGHFDQIFRIIAQSGRDIGLYGRAGKKSITEQNRLVDAIA
jgi:flagellar biosynthesis/type III secretory pathway chaperone